MGLAGAESLYYNDAAIELAAMERLSEPLRCSAGAILDTWAKHAWNEGLQLEFMQDLECLSVRTENSTYEITVLAPQTGEILVRGGRFFPEFTRARLGGSSLGGSFLKLRGIYVGFRMELHADRRWIVTSQVRSIGLVLDRPQ